MKPGIYANISNHDYHTGEGVSNSGLSLVRKSPMHYYVKKIAANDNQPAQSAAFMIGTAFHALMLEPAEFTKDYCLGLRQSDFPDAIDSSETLRQMVAKLNETRLPKLATTGSKDGMIARIIDNIPREMNAADLDLAAQKTAELKLMLEDLNKDRQGLLPTTGTIPVLVSLLRAEGIAVKLWSDIKAEWLLNNGQRIVLEPEQWDQLHNMRAAVMAHPMAARLMRMQGKAEQSVYWIDAETGELCRCRPDWWPENFCVDLKSTDDASPEGFRKSIANYAYDVQDAFYFDGLAAAGKPIRAFFFIACEKTARVIEGKSFGVAVYQLDEDSRALGRAKYRADLAKYAECRRTGIWPNYGSEIMPISLPQWNFSAHQHLVTA